MIQTTIYAGIGIVIFLLLLLFYKKFNKMEAATAASGENLIILPLNNENAIPEVVAVLDQSPPDIDAADNDISLPLTAETPKIADEPQTPTQTTTDVQPETIADQPQSEVTTVQQQETDEPQIPLPILDAIDADADADIQANMNNLSKTTVFDTTLLKPIRALDQTETTESTLADINSNLPRNEEELAMIIASKDETLLNLYCRAQTIKERNDIVRFARQAQLADKICAMSADDQEAANAVDSNMVLAILKKARSIEQELLQHETTEPKNDRDSLSLPSIPFEKEN